MLAHSVTTRDCAGEKPDAFTSTFWPVFNPVAGITVTVWCPVGAVADGAADVAGAVAGAVVAAGGAVVAGLRVNGAELLPHPAANNTSAAAAAERQETFTILTRPVVTPGRDARICPARKCNQLLYPARQWNQLHRTERRAVEPKASAY
ncbi:MAG: hypothetical protein ACYCO9_21725 [Streptosporangiaceae bacterium]